MEYALVTGASRGIGKATAIRLAKKGCGIVINYKTNDESAQATLNEIKTLGVQAELLKFDVSSESEIESALEKWEIEHPDDYILCAVDKDVLYTLPGRHFNYYSSMIHNIDMKFI